MNERVKQFYYYTVKHLTFVAVIVFCLMVGMGLIYGKVDNVPMNGFAILMFGWIFLTVAIPIYLGYVILHVDESE